MAQTPRKTVLLTTGATSPFPSLISSALSSQVLAALAACGYTHLRVQYGASELTFTSLSPKAASVISVAGFNFVESLRDEIAQADLVISHAGSGSILDALRFQKRLIVVPNEALMGNHQKELAEELGRQGYLVEGCVGYVKLPPAVGLHRFELM